MYCSREGIAYIDLFLDCHVRRQPTYKVIALNRGGRILYEYFTTLYHSSVLEARSRKSVLCNSLATKRPLPYGDCLLRKDPYLPVAVYVLTLTILKQC